MSGRTESMRFCPQEHISEMLPQLLGDRNVQTRWPPVKVNRCASRVLFTIFDARSGKFSLVQALFWCADESGVLRDTHWK